MLEPCTRPYTPLMFLNRLRLWTWSPNGLASTQAAQLCENHPNFQFGSVEIREVDFLGGPEE